MRSREPFERPGGSLRAIGSNFFNPDRTIAAGVICVYALAVLALLPPKAYLHMLGGGVVYFGAVAAVASRLHARRANFFSIYAVSVVGVAVLLMPNFPAMGGTHSRGVPIGFLGSQAGALLWISLCWAPDAKPKPRATLSAALGAGLFGAIALSLVATVPIGLGLLAGQGEMRRMVWVYPAYFAGALTAAVLYWLLQGIAHRPVGRYLIGALGGFCVYAAMGPVVSILEKEPIDLGEIAMFGIVAGCLVGPPVAMSWDEQLS